MKNTGICVILLALMLAAGCSAPLPPSTPVVSAGTPAADIPATTIISLPATATIPCPLMNATPYVGIDPIPQHSLGDIITFRGTTNLPPGEVIETGVYSAEFVPCPKWTITCQGNVTPCCGGFTDNVSVIAGPCGINTWSWDVNTSEHGFREDGEYVVSAMGRSGTVGNYGIFTVSSIPTATVPVTIAIPDPSAAPVICLPVNATPYISIDPVPGTHLGDTITVHGTTNLASGELITIRISGYMPLCAMCRGDFSDSVAACCGEFNRTVAVREGICGNNLWSLEVNTSLHDFHADDDYWIGVSRRNHEVENSSFFTVSGIPQPNLTLNLPENDTAGIVLRLSGRSNTGNGPDEKLLLRLSSDSRKRVSFTVPVYWDGAGYSWNQSVSKSKIVPYNYLTVSVSSQISPAISIQRVFLYNNEPEYYPYYPNGP